MQNKLKLHGGRGVGGAHRSCRIEIHFIRTRQGVTIRRYPDLYLSVLLAKKGRGRAMPRKDRRGVPLIGIGGATCKVDGHQSSACACTGLCAFCLCFADEKRWRDPEERKQGVARSRCARRGDDHPLNTPNPDEECTAARSFAMLSRGSIFSRG